MREMMILVVSLLLSQGCGGARVSQSPATLRNIVSASLDSTVYIDVLFADGTRNFASGVVIARDRIATCEHILRVEGETRPVAAIRVGIDRVFLSSDSVVPVVALVDKVDPLLDLLILRTEGLQAPPVAPNQVNDPRLTEVFVVGHPATEVKGNAAPGLTITTGFVIRAYEIAFRGSPPQKVLRASGRVSFGNSGGAVFARDDGTLVGIVKETENPVADNVPLVRSLEQREPLNAAVLKAVIKYYPSDAFEIIPVDTIVAFSR